MNVKKTKTVNKKALSIILTIMMIASVVPLGILGVYADTDGYWTYTVDGGKATITAYDAAAPGGDIVIPSTFAGDVEVVKIGNGVFSGRTDISGVTLPDTLAIIGGGAFSGCTGLTEISFPDSLTTLSGGSFQSTGLTSVTIPEGVTFISQAFFGCLNLTEINYNAINAEAGSPSFQGIGSEATLTIGDEVESIGNMLFLGCTAIKTLVIPGNVETIGSQAFAGCTEITSLTLNEGLEAIGYYSFGDGLKITSVTIPSSVTSIGGFAFYNDPELEYVTIKKHTEELSIGDWAFGGDNKLKGVEVHTDLVNFYSDADNLNSFAFQRNTGSDELTSCVIYGIPAEYYDDADDAKVYNFVYDANMYSVTKYKFQSLQFEMTAEPVENGTITPVGPETVTYGQEKTFNIAANVGYHIADVLADGVSVGAVGHYTFTDVTDDHTIDAEFAKNLYTVTFVDWDGDVLDEQTVAYEEAAVAPANPERTGYTFTGWDNTFNSITEDITVTAQYAVNPHNIVATAGNGGTISPVGTVVVANGTDKQFVITPNEGYHIVDVVTSEGSVAFTKDDNGIGYYTFTDVTANDTIAATFAINKYTVTFVDWNGNIIDEQEIEHGDDATLPDVPEREGYAFAGWDNIALLVNVTDDVTATAEYNTHVILADVTGTGGTISPAGEVNVAPNGNQTFTITPDEGYHVAGVSVDGAPLANPETITSYTFETVTGNHLITVSFALNEYTVRFIDVNNDVIKTEIVSHGGEATAPDFEDVPANIGYVATGWYPEDFSNVTENMDINAVYELGTYVVTFDAGEGEFLGGVKAVGSPATHGGAAIAPVINPERVGYTFAGWDANFDEVYGNITVNAVYDVNQYTVTYEGFNNEIIKATAVDYGSLILATAPDLDDVSAPTGWTPIGWNVADDATVPDDDVLVMAIFERVDYTVTFVDWDGAVLDEQTVAYEGAAVAPVDPERTGYTFDGWDVAFDYITGNLTVTATYEINQYSVTFIDWNSEVIATNTVDYGTLVLATAPDLDDVSAPTGWTPVGWNVADDATVLTMDVTVSAVYGRIDYTVTFVDWDGAVLDEQTVAYEGAAEAPEDPERIGYTFDGWDVAFNYITGNLTVTATYEINQYTVTFKGYNNETISSTSVDYGTLLLATAPEDNTAVTGWEPTGKWINDDDEIITDDATVPAEDVILHGQYKRIDYTVTFVDWDEEVIDEQIVAYEGAAVAPEDPERTGYTFTGWDVEFDYITGNLTVTATYEINYYTVTFKVNGEFLAEDTVAYQTAATAPDFADVPSPIGYHATGWDADFSCVEEDMIVNAVFTINTYTVTFDAGEGAFAHGVKTKEVSADHASAAVAPNAPTRTGYTFVGWDVEFDYVIGDMTVNAVYEINYYTVTFVDFENEIISTDSVAYLTGATAPTTVPAPIGYHAVGWNREFDSVTEDITVTAVYEINVYTVTFYGCKGEILKVETVEHGSSATAPAAPYRKCHKFVGWDTEFDNVTGDLDVTAVFSRCPKWKAFWCGVGQFFMRVIHFPVNACRAIFGAIANLFRPARPCPPPC